MFESRKYELRSYGTTKQSAIAGLDIKDLPENCEIIGNIALTEFEAGGFYAHATIEEKVIEKDFEHRFKFLIFD